MPLSSSALGVEEFAIGVASAVGCGLIVLTYLFFPNLRKLRYVELVFYVGVNDLMSSIGLALGPSPNGSVACWYQGLTSTGSFLSAIFWTNIITYQVYQVVVNEGAVLKNMFYIHCVCWGLPLLLTFLPLTTNTYSNVDDEETWCFVADTSSSPPWSVLFWVVASFYAWVWMAMLWSLFMIVSITLKLRKLRIVPDVVMSTVAKLALYPVIITVCWTLNTVANLYIFIVDKTYNEVSSSWTLAANLGVAMAASQGFLNACVFFGMNPLVREHWACLLRDLYFNICCCNCGAEVDALESEKSQILADLEAARSSSVSNDDAVTKLNTQQNSVGITGTGAAVPAANVVANRGASIQSNPTARGSSSIQGIGSARGLKLMLALEHQPDFIGSASVSSMYVHNNSSLGLPYAVGGSNGGAGGAGGAGASSSNSGGGGDGAMHRESEFLSSVESTGAPITALMHGLQRTASGECFHCFCLVHTYILCLFVLFFVYSFCTRARCSILFC